MENKSLISLIEEDDELEEIEDEDQETDRRKKRFQLALSILNFITNKRDKSSEKEEAVLSSLFDPSTKDQAKQLESLADQADSEVFASIVVESRIDQLSQEISIETDTEIVDQKLGKIKALNEIKDYLAVDVSHKRIETTKSTTGELNSSVPNVDQTPAAKAKETEKPKKHPKAKKSSNKTGPNKPKHTLEQAFRPEIRNISLVADKLEAAKSQPTQLKGNDETLKNIRSLIEKLHEQKPAQTREPVALASLEKPTISQEKYQDISRKIIIDNMSLRQFFNKNKFSESTRSRVIAEILNGEKPAKVIGREMNKRGIFKQMMKSYSNSKSFNQSHQNSVVSEMPSIATKKSMIKNSPIKLSFYSPRVWSIVILSILIIILILFMVFS